MIKYKFEYSRVSKKPYIVVDEASIAWFKEYMFLSEELNNLWWSYFDTVISELEMIKKWELDGINFGYETVDVSCGYLLWHPRELKCIIDYDYGADSLEVPFDDIYNMLRDWRDFYNAWEKQRDEDIRSLCSEDYAILWIDKCEVIQTKKEWLKLGFTLNREENNILTNFIWDYYKVFEIDENDEDIRTMEEQKEESLEYIEGFLEHVCIREWENIYRALNGDEPRNLYQVFSQYTSSDVSLHLCGNKYFSWEEEYKLILIYDFYVENSTIKISWQIDQSFIKSKIQSLMENQSKHQRNFQ